MSASVSYTRYELLRTFRNGWFFIFSLGFPLLMYLILAGSNRDELNFGNSGISAPLYYMVGLVAFGAMTAVLSGGARIAAERTVGWNRQLRLTPLRPRVYLQSKVLTGYLLAGTTIVVLYATGIAFGVRLSVDKWLQMTGLILVALLPFAAIGIWLGHLLSDDTMGAALAGLTGLLAFLGGTWFPITGSGFLPQISQLLPSYWLVQAGHVALGGSAWTGKGWTVILAWSVVFTVLAAHAYRRDTRRV